MIGRARHLVDVARLLARAWRVGRSPLFDAAWYRARHGATTWAALHYLRRGAEAGCHPGPCFDGNAYLAANEDVDLLGLNPYWHYVAEGRRQGRPVYPVALTPWRDPRSVPADDASRDRGLLAPPDGTTLSIIIPTRNNATLLARCMDGLRRHATRMAVEILVVDHASRSWRARRLLRRLSRDARIRVISFDGAFNWSAMNNAAARQARGDVLLLLNDDTSDPSPGGLDELAALALRPDVGAAGAMLLYADHTIQHAGITLGRRAIAVHLFRHATPDDPCVPQARRQVAAVTGACLAVRRELFLAVGGLDESLPVTNSDIDLCLRLRARGLAVMLTPHVRMIHAESASRGPDCSPGHRARLAAERRALLGRWGRLAETDPTLPPGTIIVAGRPMRAGGSLDALRPAHQPAAPSSPESVARHDRLPRPARI